MENEIVIKTCFRGSFKKILWKYIVSLFFIAIAIGGIYLNMGGMSILGILGVLLGGGIFCFLIYQYVTENACGDYFRQRNLHPRASPFFYSMGKREGFLYRE